MQTYPLPVPSLRLTIEGVIRTTYLLANTLRISQILGSQVDTCGFALKQPESWREGISSIKPTVGDEVIIERLKGPGGAFSRIFAGYILDVRESRLAYKTVRWDIEASDYTQLLQRRYVVGLAGSVAQGRTLAGNTATDIVKSIVAEYAPDVSTALVDDSTADVPAIAFNYELVRDAIDRLAKLIDWEWFVDYSKQLNFFDPTDAAHVSALTVTDTSNNFMDLSIAPQLDQVRNRIWVQGGESLSDEVVEVFDANGSDATGREFYLTNTDLTNVSMTVDGVPQTIGIAGQDAEDTVAFLLVQAGTPGSFAAVRNSAQTDTIPDLSRVEFRYRYKFPIALMVEDTASQTSHGLREATLLNPSLRTISEARALGNLELARWSEPITDIRFHSFVIGWQVGQTLTINVTDANTGRTFSGTALIQVVRITARGAQRLRFDVECRSARFNLIDYFRQLLKGPIGPPKNPADLNLIRALGPQPSILIDGQPAATTTGTSFYVAPDWGSGPTPPLKADY